MVSCFVFSDYEAASSKAGKVENEVKRLHNLIVDINSHKLKAQQDKLDQISKALDECSSIITKAQVAIKTADRWGHNAFVTCTFSHSCANEAKQPRASFVCRLYSNLKKCEESVTRVQAELEENQKSMAELTEQLKKLEDEAGEVMQACQESEVGSFFCYSYLF